MINRYNETGNKQMWFGDPDNLNTSKGFLRFSAIDSSVLLDDVDGNNFYRVRLNLGVPGDPNSGLIMAPAFWVGPASGPQAEPQL